jgi:hypothetical protein
MGARRFLFVTGKGGVGKTTVTAALALALAAQGKRVLVAMCGAHERLSSILGTPPIGHDLQLLWATKVDPDRAMEEYGELVIKVRAVAGMVFDNKYTQGFFRAVPGLHDWAMLGKAWYHSTETRDDGSPRFDIVLFDAPSTGHGLDMLRVPKVILDIVPPGVLRRDAEAAWAMFRDPERSGVVVVSLPEDMPTTETLELLGALDADRQSGVGSAFRHFRATGTADTERVARAGAPRLRDGGGRCHAGGGRASSCARVTAGAQSRARTARLRPGPGDFAVPARGRRHGRQRAAPRRAAARRARRHRSIQRRGGGTGRCRGVSVSMY